MAVLALGLAACGTDDDNGDDPALDDTVDDAGDTGDDLADDDDVGAADEPAQDTGESLLDTVRSRGSLVCGVNDDHRRALRCRGAGAVHLINRGIRISTRCRT